MRGNYFSCKLLLLPIHFSNKQNSKTSNVPQETRFLSIISQYYFLPFTILDNTTPSCVPCSTNPIPDSAAFSREVIIGILPRKGTPAHLARPSPPLLEGGKMVTEPYILGLKENERVAVTDPITIPKTYSIVEKIREYLIQLFSHTL